MASLVNGKHPKQIVIEYYDDLISDVDIYAEEILKKIKDDEVLNDEENEVLEENREEDDTRVTLISLQYETEIETELKNDPYNSKYTFSGHVENMEKRLLKEFVHCERMRAIETLRKVQKERLEELNLVLRTPNSPKSIQETLLGTKFCFFVKLSESVLWFEYKSSQRRHFQESNTSKITEFV
jgi:hypothetical protein